MNTNQPRQSYSTDEVEEFVAQAIDAYTADARTNPGPGERHLPRPRPARAPRSQVRSRATTRGDPGDRTAPERAH